MITLERANSTRRIRLWSMLGLILIALVLIFPRGLVGVSDLIPVTRRWGGLGEERRPLPPSSKI